tara:strand:- start:331 stop:456 length:126 start_codon:yes stop_codon:yes gene_type:complete
MVTMMLQFDDYDAFISPTTIKLVYTSRYSSNKKMIPQEIAV